MHFKDDGEGRQYLFCYDGRAKKEGCPCAKRRPLPTIRYEECETTVIWRFMEFGLEDIRRPTTEQAEIADALREAVSERRAEVEATERRIAIMNEMIETTEDAGQRNHYEGRVIALGKTRTDQLRALSDAMKSLSQVQGEPARAEEAAQRFESLVKELKNGAEPRLRMNALLREFIQVIYVFSEGLTEDMPDPFGEDLRSLYANAMTLPGSNRKELQKLLRSQQLKRFIGYMTAVRRTKAGRFLRIVIGFPYESKIATHEGPPLNDEEMAAVKGLLFRKYCDIPLPGSAGGREVSQVLAYAGFPDDFTSRIEDPLTGFWLDPIERPK